MVSQMRSLVRIVLVAAAIVAAASVVTACKQGKGDHCQIKDDCESGLVCTTLGFCESEQISPPQDAGIPDARADADLTVLDATPDAPPATADAGADAALADAMFDAS